MRIIFLLVLTWSAAVTAVAQSSQVKVNPKETLVLTADFVKTKAPTRGQQLDHTIDNNHKENRTSRFEAKEFLKTQGEMLLSNSENYSFTADDSILLSPGFEVAAGTEFTAEITPIDTNKSVTNYLKLGAPPSHPDQTLAYENTINLFDFTLYPNPASENINLGYELNKEAVVSISLHNLYGTKVQSFLTAKPQEPGKHTLVFPVKNIPSGIYIVNLSIDGHIINQRIILR